MLTLPIKQRFVFLLRLGWLLFIPLVTKAAQPMISDDAGTAKKNEFDFYLFSTLYKTPLTTWWIAPGLEVDYGVTSALELHLSIPYLTISSKDITRARGLSDIEVGLKLRFLEEQAYLPGIAFAPVVELPTGNVNRNLGNGRAWYEFPIWFAKNWPKFEVYGGGGYIYNGEPGIKNAYFLGGVFQYNYNDNLQISFEIYSQSALSNNFGNVQDEGYYTFFNSGISYTFYPHLALQFAIGHSFLGVPQWYNYVGLYYDVTV